MKFGDLKYLDEVKSKLKRIKIKAVGKRWDFNRNSNGVDYSVVSFIYKGECYVDKVTSSID